jgi:hypothetical protein
VLIRFLGGDDGGGVFKVPGGNIMMFLEGDDRGDKFRVAKF